LKLFRKKRFHVAVGLIVFAAVFGLIFSRVSFRDVFASIRGMDRAGLAAYAALAVALSVLRTVRYRLLLRAAGLTAPAWRTFLAVLVRGACVDMLPARTGELVYIGILRSRLGIPTVSAAVNFGAAFVMDILALGPMILGAAILLGSGGAVSGRIVMAGGGIILAGSFAAVMATPRALGIAETVLSRRAAGGRRWAAALRIRVAEARREVGLLGSPSVLAHTFLLSLLVRLCKYTALYVLLAAILAPRGFGGLSPAMAFVGLCSAEMAASLPMSGIGGFGAYEGTWALVFAMLGLPADLAMTTGVAHHLTTQAFAAVLGATAGAVLAASRPLPVSSPGALPGAAGKRG